MLTATCLRGTIVRESPASLQGRIVFALSAREHRQRPAGVLAKDTRATSRWAEPHFVDLGAVEFDVLDTDRRPCALGQWRRNSLSDDLERSSTGLLMSPLKRIVRAEPLSEHCRPSSDVIRPRATALTKNARKPSPAFDVGTVSSVSSSRQLTQASPKRHEPQTDGRFEIGSSVHTIWSDKPCM